MNDSSLTPLETAVFGVFHDAYRHLNLPPPSEIRVRSRKNTGAGRYVQVEPVDVGASPDGYLDMAGRFIEMKGVPFGIMAVVAIEHGQLVQLELAVYGDDAWDGVEREWAVVGEPREPGSSSSSKT